jgi:hypothetical protein
MTKFDPATFGVASGRLLNSRRPDALDRFSFDEFALKIFLDLKK